MTTHIETEATPVEDADNAGPHATDPVVESFVHAGRAWARYGLRLGQAALQNHSEAMRATSDALKTFADSLEKRGSRAQD